MATTRPRLLIFRIKTNPDSQVLYQTVLSSVLFILLNLGFLTTAIIAKNVNYLIGWIIIGGLDVLLEWAIIIFFKKDAVRENQQIVESGSLWSGNREYKVLKTGIK